MLDPFAFWYGLINYEQRTPSPDDFKLDRMRELLARLGDPHTPLRIIHVTGSKGKGSTSAMLAAILRSAGYRTGLFTSPHLSHVEERFQVDGRPIPTSDLRELLAEVQRAVESLTHDADGKEHGLLTPTFFEVATAVGFLYFLRQQTDFVVLEVGLGGRLDSTNVCLPLVSIITSISFDHMKQLGPALADIAREKAGIFKKNRPALSAATTNDARIVIEEAARQVGCPLRQLGFDFTYQFEPGHVTTGGMSKSRVQVTSNERVWPPMEINLLGEHQAANAALVLACVEELRKQEWIISDQAVATGLARVVWPARMEPVGVTPCIVLDCAHNVASAEALVDTLRTSFPPCRRLLIFASSGDKDVAGIFRVLVPHFERAFFTSFTSNSRALPPELLGSLWTSASGGEFSVHPTAAEALAAARGLAGQDDLICITGSVFLAGEMRPLLDLTPPGGGAG